MASHSDASVPADERALERREWLDSLDEVLARSGPERVKELLAELSLHAQTEGVHVPFAANTAYVNTIPRAEQPAYPGDLGLEERLTIYDPQAIPAVVFTDPGIAWAGLSEDEARRQGLNVRVGSFPWQASGRAATLDRTEGLTKIIADAGDGRVLGVGVAGHSAGELIGEAVLAIEMGAVAEDLALTVHAHPSLSETIMEAAERVLGQSTHFFQRM